MPRLANSRGEYFASAVLHRLYRADEVLVHLHGVNGLGFCFQHRLHALFDVQDVLCRIP